MGKAGPDATPDPSGARLLKRARAFIAIYIAIKIPVALSLVSLVPPEDRTSLAVRTVMILLVVFALMLFGTRRIRLRYAVGVLAGLAVLTYLPLVLTGEWEQPLAAAMAAGLLLLLRPPFSWLLCLAVVAMEVVIRSLLDQPFFEVTYGLTATVNGMLLLYVLAWLVGLARELHTTRVHHAEAAAARDRLESSGNLRDTLANGLAQIEDTGNRALQALTLTPAKAGTEIQELIRVARRTLSHVRAVAAAHREPLPTGPPARQTPGARLVWLYLVVLAVTFSFQQIMLVSGEPDATVTSTVAAALIATGIGVLMVRHVSTVLRNVRPKGWPVTLTLQALLTLVPYLLFGPPWNCCSGTLAAACLVLVRSPWRWVFTAAVLAAQSLTTLMWNEPLADANYHMAVVITVAVNLYAALWVATLAVQLDAVRARLAVMAVLHERIRLSRDIHDLLGLGLSTITMKAELAARLIDTDPDKAQQELTELVSLTTRSLTQVRAVTDEHEHVLTLDEEATEARAALAAAGAQVRLDLDRAPLPPALDTTLAVLLRESVTNILRHSTPARCTIKTTLTDGVLQLHIDNDGVLKETREGGGAGLANLAARAQAAGGVLTAGPGGDGTFVLRAELPT